MSTDQSSQSSTIHLTFTPHELRELADVLHWAVFQLGYTPRETSREELEALAARIGFEALQAAPPVGNAQSTAALHDYMNVLLDNNDVQHPYQIFIFKNGLQVELVRLPDLASAADLCRQHGLPVVASDPQVSIGLHAYGIESLSSTNRR
jgi:hypothetical protein